MAQSPRAQTGHLYRTTQGWMTTPAQGLKNTLHSATWVRNVSFKERIVTKRENGKLVFADRVESQKADLESVEAESKEAIE
jgi:hypothetical protein